MTTKSIPANDLAPNYREALDFLRSLQRADASFDAMSLNLDLFMVDTSRQLSKSAARGYDQRAGIDLIQIPMLGGLTEFPLAMGFQIYRMMIQWYFNHLMDSPDMVVELGCGAGQLIVSIARASPSKTFIAADISDDALECVRILAFAAGVANVKTLRMDAMHDDVDDLHIDQNFLVLTSGALAAIPDGGKHFFNSLAKTLWSGLCLFEPISDQMIGPTMIDKKWTTRSASRAVWQTIDAFRKAHGRYDAVIKDFCGFSPMYPHTLISIKRSEPATRQ